MKKRHKIALVVTSSVVMAFVIVWGILHIYANKFVSKHLDAMIKERLADFETVRLSYGEITIGWFSRDIHIQEVDFMTDTIELDMSHNGIKAHIPEVIISGIDLREAARDKTVMPQEIELTKPDITVYYGGDDTLNVAKKLQQMKADSTRKVNLKNVVTELGVGKFKISDGRFLVKNISNKFELETSAMSLLVNEVRYNMVDSLLTYNDSLYGFSAQDFHVTMPDGLYKMRLNAISTENGGGISLRGLKVWCALNKEKLVARKKGKTAVWLDVNIDKLGTSPFNIIKSVKDKIIDIDKLHIGGNDSHIFVSSGKASDKTSHITLEDIFNIGYKVNIRSAHIDFPHFTAGISTTKGKNISVSLSELDTEIRGICNKRGQVIDADLSFKAEGQGNVHTSACVKLDEKFDYTLQATLTNLDSQLLRTIVNTTLGVKPVYTVESVHSTLKGDVSRLAGNLTVKDIRLFADSATLKKQRKGTCVDIEQMSVSNINVQWDKPKKIIGIGNFMVQNPKLSVVIDKNKQKKSEVKRGTAHNEQIDITVDTISIENAQLSLSNTYDKLDVKAANINASVNEMTFSTISNTLHFNETGYNISVEDFYFMKPDGNYRMSFDKLSTSNAGAVVITNLLAGCPLAKHELAEKLGNQPATWSEMKYREIRTSPINVPRLIKSKAINIDKVACKGDYIAIYRDVRFESKDDCPMPQDGLMKMTIPLNINHVDMTAEKFFVEVAMPTGRVGGMTMTDIKAGMNNITNRKGQVIDANMSLKMGTTGTGELDFTMTLDEAKSFTVAADVNNLKASSFDEFMRPLFGITVTSNITHLDTRYSGDKIRSQGDFIMLYNDMKVKAYKGESPYDALAKHAGLVTAVGGMVLQHKNPMGSKPAERIPVSYERNPKKEFAVYVVMTMINGIMQTVLPGSVVKTINKKISAKKQKAEQEQNNIQGD